jgi:hypothetical protein
MIGYNANEKHERNLFDSIYISFYIIIYDITFLTVVKMYYLSMVMLWKMD